MKNTYALSLLTLGLFATTLASAQQANTVRNASRQALFTAKAQSTYIPQTGDVQRGGGQPNDDCAGATLVTVNETCVSVSASMGGATESLPPATCSGFTAGSASDVWFTFVATGNITVVEATGGTEIDAVLEVFSAPCVDLASLGCRDATITSETESFAFSTTPGNTYYYRVYPYVVPTTDFDFTTCVYSPTNVAANDLCSDAVTQPLAIDGSVVFTGDNTGALDTEGIGIANVWESFTTTECANIAISYCGTDPAFLNGFIQMYSDCPPTLVVASTSFDQTTCADGNLTVFFSLVPPGTYYYPVLSEVDSQGPYTITVSATACPPPPANDACANAEVLTVGNIGDCPANATLGDNSTASDDGVAFSCGTGGPLTVWYTFNSGASEVITFSYTDFTFTTLLMEVFEGACGGPSVFCALGVAALQGTFATTPNTDYWIQVGSDAGTGGAFNICLSATPPGPPNDNCAGAAGLSPNVTCVTATYVADGATQSLPGITCNAFTGNANDDIWFSFVATNPDMSFNATGTDDGDGDPNTGYDAVIEVFDGCGGASLGCADATLGNEEEVVTLTGLTVGNTYYARVYDWFSGNPTPNSVEVCVVDPLFTGVAENAQSNPWSIYPNPSEGFFNVSYSGPNVAGNIDVFDVTGRTVYSVRTQLATGTVRSIDLSAMSAGTYTVRLTAGDVRSEQRLMVK